MFTKQELQALGQFLTRTNIQGGESLMMTKLILKIEQLLKDEPTKEDKKK